MATVGPRALLRGKGAMLSGLVASLMLVVFGQALRVGRPAADRLFIAQDGGIAAGCNTELAEYLPGRL